jgi:uncharacterized UPF0160 family protein
MIPRSLGVHDGTFHSDEVTACALLLLCDLIDEDKVVRTREPALLDACEYVCDVGGVYNPKTKRFDHHQVEYTGPLSSAGMVLQYLVETGKLSAQEGTVFNENFISGVDAHDNGRTCNTVPSCCSFSHVISNFTPIHRDAPPEEENETFHEAVAFVLGHLKRLKTRVQYTTSCAKIVKKAMDEAEDCLIFDRNIPWMESFFALGGERHPARFLIMPSGHHWKLRGIPPTLSERMKVRTPLPQEWAGLLDDDLKKKTGIPGAVFCHKGRFVSVWETKGDALKALDEIRHLTAI